MVREEILYRAPVQNVHWQFRLSLPLLLAVRYLRSSRREAYVTFLSLLAAGGITLGVAALILVQAGLSGLQDFLRKDVLARTPHLEIELPRGTDSATWLPQLIALPGVREAQRILRGRGWLRQGERVLAVQLIGYQGNLPRIFPRPAAADPASADPQASGLHLSEAVATAWGLTAGDLVDLVSPRPTLTPFGPQPRMQQIRVAGTFTAGRTEDGQERVALPLAIAERLLGREQARLELQTTDLETALTLVPAVTAQLPAGSRVRTWKDLNRALFFALRLEKVLMFVAVFLIVPIAALALLTVLALLISSKRAEIGMLQAMGATPQELGRAFAWLGGLLGVLGLSLGSALGVGGAWLLDHYRLLRPPGDVYFIDHIPFRVEPVDLLTVLVLTLGLTLLSTLLAARRASGLGVVDAWR